MPQPFSSRKITGAARQITGPRGRRAFAREERSANASGDISSILQAVPPPKRLLDESRALGPKAVPILLGAFDAVVAELDLQTTADKERTAKIVIRLALGQKDLVAARLRGSAIIALRRKAGHAVAGPF